MMLLKELRQQKGVLQKDVAAYLGVDRTTYVKYERGDSEPNLDTLKRLASYFGVSVDYLLGTPAEPAKERVHIPVLGRVAAGIPIEAVEEIIDYEEIDAALAQTGEFFALRIKGTSMEPRICEGDVVIVRKQDTIESGEIAIVLINGDEATCKKVILHQNGLSLVSFNPSFVPMFFPAEEVESKPIRIIGKVVELRGKF